MELEQNKDSKQKVMLTDKREIVLNDDTDISVSIILDKEVKYTFPIPYPSCGYGGGSLLVSDSEQYLLFSYYSGECDEGFILFKVDGCNLEVIYESECFYGEGASYCFAQNESLLAQTLRTGWWYADEAQIDKNGKQFYQFGIIHILNIKEKIMKKYVIHVYPSTDWQEEITDNGAFVISEVVDDNILKVVTPWGEEIIELPIEKRTIQIIFKKM